MAGYTKKSLGPGAAIGKLCRLCNAIGTNGALQHYSRVAPQGLGA